MRHTFAQLSTPARAGGRLSSLCLLLLAVLSLLATAVVADEFDLRQYLNVYYVPADAFIPSSPTPVAHNVAIEPSYVPVMLRGALEPAFRAPDSAESRAAAAASAVPAPSSIGTYLVQIDESLNWNEKHVASVDVAALAAPYTRPAKTDADTPAEVGAGALVQGIFSLRSSTDGLFTSVLFSSSPIDAAHSAEAEANTVVLGYGVVTLKLRVQGPIAPLFDADHQFYAPKNVTTAPAALHALPSTANGDGVGLSGVFVARPVSAAAFSFDDAYRARDDVDETGAEADSAESQARKRPVAASRVGAGFEPGRHAAESKVTVGAPVAPSAIDDPTSLVNTLPVARASKDGSKERLDFDFKEGDTLSLFAADSVTVHGVADDDTASPPGFKSVTARLDKVDAEISLLVPYYVKQPTLTLTLSGVDGKSALPLRAVVDVCSRGYLRPAFTTASDGNGRDILLTPVVLTVTLAGTKAPAAPVTLTYIKACEPSEKTSPGQIVLIVFSVLLVVGALVFAVFYLMALVKRSRARARARAVAEAEGREYHELGDGAGTVADEAPFFAVMCPCFADFSTASDSSSGRAQEGSDGMPMRARPTPNNNHHHHQHHQQQRQQIKGDGTSIDELGGSGSGGYTAPAAAPAPNRASVSVVPADSSAPAVIGGGRKAGRTRGTTAAPPAADGAGVDVRAPLVVATDAAPPTGEEQQTAPPVVIRGGRKSKAAKKVHTNGGVPVVPNMPTTSGAEIMARLQGTGGAEFENNGPEYAQEMQSLN